MPSITTWHRIEPISRSERLNSLQARLADPLWMIGRQWQTGELAGSDTGSPIKVRLTAEHSRIGRWAPTIRSATSGTIGGAGDPLPEGRVIEDFVDSVRPRAGLIDRARGGRHFLRRLGVLAGRYAAGYLANFALPVFSDKQRDASDERGIRWAALLAGRSIDGAALRAVIGPPGAHALPSKPEIDPGDVPAVLEAAGEFAAWWDEQFPMLNGAWQPRQLAAPFQLGLETSRGTLALIASEHRGGRIDWYSFDAFAGVPSADAPSTLPPKPAESLPSRITFPGMPRPRWWEFEDAAVDLSRIDAAPDDLGRLLLAEFALLYGNDFFAVPVVVNVGTLCRIVGLEVETCFGDKITVPSSASFDANSGARRSWKMFQCDGDISWAGLVVPPTAVGEIRGAAREEVLIVRDEMANVAWAIELKVTGPLGAVVERREVESARRTREGTETATQNALSYRLSTTLPESWYPLVPIPDGTMTLQGSGRPAGQLMEGGLPFKLDALELPRVGRRVTLTPHRARAADGSVLIWMAWEARPGRGESSSGLRFDELTHELPP